MNQNWNNISNEISELVENVLRTRLLYLEDRYIWHLSTEIGFKVADILCSRNYIVNHPVRLNIPFVTMGCSAPSHLTITAGTMTSADDLDASLTASISFIQHNKPFAIAPDATTKDAREHQGPTMRRRTKD